MQIIQRSKRWTDDERAIIKDNYLKLSDEEIGKLINRSSGGVKGERQKMNLYRPRSGRSGNNTRSKKAKPTFEEIKQLCDEKGYILLSDEKEYINQQSKLRYICKKHKDKGEQIIPVYHFKKGEGCYYCGRERTEQAHKSKVTHEEDKKLCELKGFDYVKT